MHDFDFQNARFLFTDVDDTLTTDGQLRPETYSALWRLADAGIVIVPVTGGCAGWCDQIIRTWPVRAVIGEGGSFYFSRSANGSVDCRYWVDHESHQADRLAIIKAIGSLDPDLNITLAKDHHFRLVDVAIDYNQDCRLPESQVHRIMQALLDHGFRVKKSSIHINVAQGTFDKCAMTRRMAAELFNLSAEELKARSVFIGDAPNDESMFAFFPQSVGVANIQPHLEYLESRPAHVTEGRCGSGFVELADQWLASITPPEPVRPD
ncbi:HAD-IIB family hydrolase [Marinobacter sp.]|uniref:HAD-IIB family hydrolase n=1 Tax=Marinobacter sp. TaxID=50741 RepID=UPI00384E8E39